MKGIKFSGIINRMNDISLDCIMPIILFATKISNTR